jgi:hypothetical protein
LVPISSKSLSFRRRPPTSSLLYLCTVSLVYSDASHLRASACQYKDIPVVERNGWTARRSHVVTTYLQLTMSATPQDTISCRISCIELIYDS